MVSALVIILSISLFLTCVLIAWKKPEVIKKDISKPLSISNFSLKKTFIGDWKSFGTWILLMFLVWSYAQDTASCREMMSNIDEICAVHMNNLATSMNTYDIDDINFNITFNGTNRSTEVGGDNQQRIPNLIPTNS